MPISSQPCALGHLDILPAETRIHIYLMLFASEERIFSECFWIPYGEGLPRMRRMQAASREQVMFQEHLSAQLLRCSKAIYLEALPYLYNTTIFHMSNASDITQLVAKADRSYLRRRPGANEIAHIERSIEELNLARIRDMKKLPNLRNLTLVAKYHGGDAATLTNYSSFGIGPLPVSTAAIMAVPRGILYDDGREARPPHMSNFHPFVIKLIEAMPNLEVVLIIRCIQFRYPGPISSYMCEIPNEQAFKYHLELVTAPDGMKTLTWDCPMRGLKTVFAGNGPRYVAYVKKVAEDRVFSRV